MKVSRLKVIQMLVRKRYKAKRPTAEQINEIIHAYNLNKYTADGKKRSREVISQAMAKAVNSLK